MLRSSAKLLREAPLKRIQGSGLRGGIYGLSRGTVGGLGCPTIRVVGGPHDAGVIVVYIEVCCVH